MRLFIVAGTMAFIVSAAPVLAQDPDLISVSAGAYDFEDYEDESAELRVEYRSGWKILYQRAQERTLAFLRPQARAIARRRLCSVLPMSDHVCPFMGSLVLGVEFGPVFRGIGPMVGLMANTDGGVFGYGGIYADIRLGDRMVVYPSAELGGHSEGDSRNLGGVFQFHLGVTAAYRFEDDSSLEITVTHISNASIHDENPGVESILLTYRLATTADYRTL